MTIQQQNEAMKALLDRLEKSVYSPPSKDVEHWGDYGVHMLAARSQSIVDDYRALGSRWEQELSDEIQQQNKAMKALLDRLSESKPRGDAGVLMFVCSREEIVRDYRKLHASWTENKEVSRLDE